MKTNFFFHISLSSSKNKNFCRQPCRENQNTFCVKWLFFFENSTAYEMMWNNIVEPDRPQMTIGTCSLHAGYLSLQTPSEYVIRFLVYSAFIKWIVTFLILRLVTIIKIHASYVIVRISHEALPLYFEFYFGSFSSYSLVLSIRKKNI
jgi:hypothetical protein